MASTVSEVIFRLIADASGLKKESKDAEKHLKSLSDVNFNSLQRRINHLKMALRTGWDIKDIDNLKRTLESLDDDFKDLERISDKSLRSLRQELTKAALAFSTFGSASSFALKQVEEAIEDLDRELRKLDSAPHFSDLTTSLTVLQTVLRNGWSENGSEELEQLQEALERVQKELSDTSMVGKSSLELLEKNVDSTRLSFERLGSSGSRSIDEIIRALQQAQAELIKLSTMADLTDLNSELDSMDASINRSNESVKKTRHSVTELNIELDNLGNKSTTVAGRVSKIIGLFDSMGGSASDAGDSVGFLVKSLIAISPGVIPILASTVTSTMGLGASFVAAGAGVTGFTAVAIPNLLSVFEALEEINKAQDKYNKATTEKEKLKALAELESIYAELDEEQKAALKSLQDFKDFFLEFAEEFRKPVFTIFSQSLDFLRQLLNEMKPAISSASDGISTIISLLTTSLDTKEWQEFFGFIGSRAGPSLVAFSKGIGNVLTGLINLFMAFSPLAEDMENGFIRMTKRFSEWSYSLQESDGFQRFIEYSLRNVPAVLKFISNLNSIIGNLVVTLSPIGEVVLVILNVITGFLAEILRVTAAFSQWEGFLPLVTGLAASFMALKAAMMISSAISMITMLANPINRAMLLTMAWSKFQSILNATMLANPYVLIAALIAGIGVAFYTAYQRSEGFREGVNNALASVRSVTESSITFISNIASTMWNSAIANTESFRNTVGAEISNLGQSITQGFQNAMVDTRAFFIEAGHNIASLFGEGMRNRATSVIQGFLEQLKFGFSSLGGVTSMLAPLLTSLALGFMGVGGPIALLIGGVVSLTGYLYRLYETNETVRKAFDAAGQGIQNTFGAAMVYLQPLIQVFSNSFKQMAQELGPEFQKTGQVIRKSILDLQPAFQELSSTFGLLLITVIQAFSELAIQLQPVVSQFASGIASLIPVVIPVITQLVGLWVQFQQTLMSTILNVVTTVLPLLLNAFTQIFPMVLRVIQSVLPIVVNLLLSIIPVISQIALTILPLLLQVVTMVFPLVLQIIQAVLPIFLNLLQLLIPIITQLARTIIPLILQAVMAVFPIFLQIVQSVIPIVIGLLKLATQIITTVLIPAIKFILQIAQMIFPALLAVIQNALTIITNIIRLWTSLLKGDWSGAWQAVLNILNTIWSSIKVVIQTATNLVLLAIRTAWTTTLNVTKSIFTSVWSFFSTIFSQIYTSVSGYVSRIWQNIRDGWQTAKNKTVEIFTSMKNTIANTFTDVVEGAKKLPGRIGEGIKAMAGNVKDGVKSLSNSLAQTLGKGINGAIKGVNWVLDKIGVDKKIKEWPIPEYKNGTKGHPGGLAILGDGKMEEAYFTPDGRMGISPATDTLMNLPAGTQVFSGPQTKQLMNSGLIPKYATGTVGNWIKEKGQAALNTAGKAKDAVVGKAKAGAKKAKDVALDVWNYASNPKELMKKVYEEFIPKLPNIGGAFDNILSGSISKVKDSFLPFMKKKLDGFMSGGGPAPAGKGAAAWRPVILAAAARMNEQLSEREIQGIISQIHRESGGNQRIIQSSAVWDVNTAAGNPARGFVK